MPRLEVKPRNFDLQGQHFTNTVTAGQQTGRHLFTQTAYRQEHIVYHVNSSTEKVPRNESNIKKFVIFLSLQFFISSKSGKKSPKNFPQPSVCGKFIEKV